MTDTSDAVVRHSHSFLGAAHEQSERKTWVVIWLCAAMMIVEIVGGLLFGSIALVADGLHMSTHAGALLLAALAYTYARRHVDDPRFTFGTGKLGDLAGFTSAIILAMIALVIGSTPSLSAHLFGPHDAMAAVIANQFGEASGTFRAALIGLGVVLFVITIIVNLLGRIIVKRGAVEGLSA